MTEKSHLILAYREAAIAHYDATLRNDWLATHTTSDRMVAARESLFAHQNEMMQEIVGLLHDEHTGVRLGIACALCDRGLDNFKVRWVLRKIAWFQYNGLGVIACWKLRELRKRNHK